MAPPATSVCFAIPNAVLMADRRVRNDAQAMPTPVERITQDAGAIASPRTIAVSTQAMAKVVDRILSGALTTAPRAIIRARAQIVEASRTDRGGSCRRATAALSATAAAEATSTPTNTSRRRSVSW